jgi:hypothetical protein
MSIDGRERSKKALEDSVEKIRIEIRGPIILGNPNVVKFSMNTLKYDGIIMILDMLEKLTDIEYFMGGGFLTNLTETGDKERFSSLRDLMIRFLEKKVNTDIKICGFCKNYKIYSRKGGITIGHCSRPKCPHSRIYFDDYCAFKPTQWEPKEITE